jgi:hypothetical protein
VGRDHPLPTAELLPGPQDEEAIVEGPDHDLTSIVDGLDLLI